MERRGTRARAIGTYRIVRIGDWKRCESSGAGLGTTTHGCWERAPFEVVHAGHGATRVGGRLPLVFEEWWRRFRAGTVERVLGSHRTRASRWNDRSSESNLKRTVDASQKRHATRLGRIWLPAEERELLEAASSDLANSCWRVSVVETSVENEGRSIVF